MTSLKVSRLLLLPILAMAMAACTSVDSTEHCVRTRYGKVTEEKMDVGLALTVLSSATCFTMTEKNFPEDPDDAEKITAQTRDPITVEGDVGVVYKFDPATIFEVFMEKRTPQAAEVEVLNAIREGYRNALARWTMAEVFDNRAQLADSVKAQIQRKLGNRAIIQQVFVRDITVPKVIEDARLLAAQQDQILDKAQKQYIIDSVNARAIVITADANAQAKRLEATSYLQNPQLIQLEIAKAWASGVAGACGNAQTCVVGGSVMDSWKGVR